MNLNEITETFVAESRSILGSNLVGVYLHGSAVMGCFHEKKSDIDLLVVVEEALPDAVKRRFMDMVVRLNEDAPPKGIEMSIIRRAVCRPFVYPTPFELHFSVMHLERYRADPLDYVRGSEGVDKDLAAHITITCHRGQCLYGEAISEVFEPVKKEYYFDSIWYDVEDAVEAVASNPTYVILNLCRVLAYGREGLVLSKREGGEWGLTHLPEEYHALIGTALADYAAEKTPAWREDRARDFAVYMLERIRGCVPCA